MHSIGIKYVYVYMSPTQLTNELILQKPFQPTHPMKHTLIPHPLSLSLFLPPYPCFCLFSYFYIYQTLSVSPSPSLSRTVPLLSHSQFCFSSLHTFNGWYPRFCLSFFYHFYSNALMKKLMVSAHSALSRCSSYLIIQYFLFLESIKVFAFTCRWRFLKVPLGLAIVTWWFRVWRSCLAFKLWGSFRHVSDLIITFSLLSSSNLRWFNITPAKQWASLY